MPFTISDRRKEKEGKKTWNT